MNDFEITVTTASGLESVTKRELIRLGADDPKAINGSFTFKGSELSVARLNMFLRTADRVYIKLAQFTAVDFDALFEGVYAVRWEDIVNPDGNISVNGKSRESALFALSACQKIIKKAILKRLGDKTGRIVFPESAERYDIEFTIFRNTVCILLNTSGVGLHKRGYRDRVGIAPIRETLAAGMLMLSGFGYTDPFADVFCGSGTLVIEGARQALNIASGLLRDFDYLHFKKFDNRFYEEARQEALDKERRDRVINFVGYDIDKNAIKLARHHAEKAGLLDRVKFEQADVKNFHSDLSGGYIVTNAPYGERSLDMDEARVAYKDLGTAFKKLDNWSCCLLTSDTGFEECFGGKADKNRKLYNAGKECRFYQYYAKRDRFNKDKK